MIFHSFEYLNHVMDVMTIYRSDIVYSIFAENSGIHNLFLDGITHRYKSFIQPFPDRRMFEIPFQIMFDVEISVGCTQFGKCCG